MIATSIAFSDWRNLASADVTLAPGINVLWGMNAQGKSNILEGIYYFARGRSFRGAKDRELIRFGSDFASAALSFRKNGYAADTSLQVTVHRKQKKLMFRNGAQLSSPAEMMGNFRAVLFSPANLALVSGGPMERRQFLDIAISQLSPAYLGSLRVYCRALAERNALIKLAADGHEVSEAEWEVYADVLSQRGALIAAYRNEYVLHLNHAVAACFADMTGGAEVPELKYASHALGDDPSFPFTDPSCRPDPSVLHGKLMANTDREIAAGSTLWGIHKDDIGIFLNGAEARSFSSQGQQRSIALSMKLAEAEISRDLGGEYPVILLDDVFSELDRNRRSFILGSLGEEPDRQIIITSCEPDVVPDGGNGQVNFRHVENGAVSD